MAITKTTNSTKVWNFLIKQGFTKAGAAGLMGNIYAESGMIPNRVQILCLKRLKQNGKGNYTDTSYTEAVDSGKITKKEFLNPLPNKQYGYGLCQWTSPSRKEKLYNLAKTEKKSIGNIDIQLKFLINELKTSYKNIYNILKTTSSIKIASDKILKDFESPANASSYSATRLKYSEKYYNLYNNSSTIVKKSINEIAKEVINGIWDSGEARKKKLIQAGYDYQEVQNEVNKILSNKTTNTSNKITAEDVLNVMRGWIGLSRSAGTHKIIIDTYNKHKPLARGYKVTYSDAYCDTTVSAAFIKLNAVNLIGGTECGVQDHVAIFKRNNIWEENGNITPEPGYIIVYNWNDNTQPNDGYSDHIGLVEKVSNGQITAIEGNMNGGVVGRRTIPVGWGYIRGYAKPKYEIEATSTVNITPGGIPVTQKSNTTNTNVTVDYADSFDKKIAKTYKTISNLNLRSGANLNKPILAVIPKNGEVHCYGYYTKEWYYVKYKNLTGFCLKKYLK